MKQTEMVGKAQTVLGPIDADSLGVTLTHEHLIIDFTRIVTATAPGFIEPTDPEGKEFAYQPVKLENLYWVRFNKWSNLDNMQLLDTQLIIDDVKHFKQAGGSTIVSQSVRAHSSDPLKLVEISRATGVNIIMASGNYVAKTHPPELATMTEEEIANQIIRDITLGIGDTGVHAGLIKGATGSSPEVRIQEGERKVLRACALAQRRTGAAIGIHEPRKQLAWEALETLGDAGADLSRTILYHVDLWGTELPMLPRLLQTGCYLEFDTFGNETAMIPPFPDRPDSLSDSQRCDVIMNIIALGYPKQILISQDIFLKHRLAAFGGCSHAHILRHVLPLMRYKGISDEQIHTIMVENPKRVLAFVPAKQ